MSEAGGPLLEAGRLTARGEGGLAVFRLRGSEVAAVLGRIFRPRGGSPLLPGQLRVGSVQDGETELDEAVLRIRETGRGWEADLSTHGGLYVSDRVQAMLEALGAAPIAADEAWAFGPVAGVVAGDRFVADARDLLLESFAPLQTEFFLDALDGGLSRSVHALERSAASGAADDALLARIEALLDRAPLGLAMARSPVVLLTGAPNAGKSTLFNALLGEARAIVSDEPGTTRDVVAEPFACRGFPLRLLDSAGIRASSDPVEKVGVARARAALASADIVVTLIDPAAETGEQLKLAQLIEPARRIVVLSKADDPASAGLRARHDALALLAIPVSARSGEGIADLEARILAASPFGGAVSHRQVAPFRPRHEAVLVECRDSVRLGAPRARVVDLLARLRTGEIP